ncbi:uncharacterized protein N0V96_007841 [Colletotrichum fioriniae]|uniref:uncharacterized protein n=1 Tax=Colletotrichum fioriniae TaxID=710243 RepID=UPI0032DBB0DB|nr:hypothetical protein N0V96_007841 [Colletotrichum fioriniae]
MSSSLARTRSLRKPTQGSSTDLPPTTTTISHGDGHNRLRSAQEKEAEPLIVVAKQELLHAPTSFRDNIDVDKAERCGGRCWRGRRINQLGTNERPFKQDKRALGPHKDNRGWLRTVDADDSETDHLGRSTILKTRRRNSDDFDSSRGWKPDKGPRARKERRNPEQHHRSPTPEPDIVFRGRWPCTEITPDVPLRGASHVFLPIFNSIHDHEVPSTLRNRPPFFETIPRAGSTTTAPPPPRQPLKQPQKPPPSHQAAPPHLARQQAQQRHPSPTSPPRTTKPVLRPAFSTLQQHYSPAKSLAPKPLTATYLAAPSPSKLPANIALTAETSRLQTELLQLHLLHRDLPQVTSQWHASARSKLAARHADLAASARSLVTLESDAAERRNLAALQSWGATPSTGGRPTSSSSSPLPLEDRIQRLDALLTSLWSLDSPGGKHHRLVRTFERWASSLADLEAARARAEDGADPSALLDDSADVRFGGGLDARWKEEAAALVRRLEGWDAQLRELEYGGDDDEDAAAGAGAGTDATAQASSLKRMLDGCSSLVRDMLDELAVMEDIEAAAVERENEWIKKMNREGDDGRGRDTQRAGAIWRVI